MPQRKAHVKRVYNTDNQGNVDQSTWIDVMRIDTLPINLAVSDTGETQLTNYKFAWMDDPSTNNGAGDAQGENANQKRMTEQLAVKNSSGSQLCNLWIVDKMTIATQGAKDGTQGRNVNYSFDNKPLDNQESSQTRQTTVINVISNDLAGLDMSHGPVNWDTYQQALQNGNGGAGSISYSTQGLNVEVVDKFKVLFGAQDTGEVGQAISWNLKGNQAIEQLFALGNQNATNSDGSSAVIRTDPFQVIVNFSSFQYTLELDASASNVLSIFGPPSVSLPDVQPAPVPLTARQNNGPTKSNSGTVVVLAPGWPTWMVWNSAWSGNDAYFIIPPAPMPGGTPAVGGTVGGDGLSFPSLSQFVFEFFPITGDGPTLAEALALGWSVGPITSTTQTTASSQLFLSVSLNDTVTFSVHNLAALQNSGSVGATGGGSASYTVTLSGPKKNPSPPPDFLPSQVLSQMANLDDGRDSYTVKFNSKTQQMIMENGSWFTIV
jgi:hypothetical protein